MSSLALVEMPTLLGRLENGILLVVVAKEALSLPLVAFTECGTRRIFWCDINQI